MPWLLERIGVYSFNDEEATQMNIYTHETVKAKTLLKLPSSKLWGTISTTSIRGKPALYSILLGKKKKDH